MQMNRPFLERLNEYLQNTRHDKIRITKISVLQDVIAFVRDEDNDIDVYFDPNCIEVVHSMRWGNLPFPAELEPYNLGRLVAESQIPNARTIELAFHFVRLHLRPTCNLGLDLRQLRDVPVQQGVPEQIETQSV